MFSLLSMSPISDWLAPDLSPLEEFKAQYEMFLSYFAQQRENGIEICKCHIESTNLTMILTKMCNLLVFEQAEICDPNAADSISTSIEYFLQNNIANILAVYAQADAPLGLCPIILLFFNKLIVDCKLDLMPHVCFHSAINKLVSICGRIPAGPYETYEIIFLRSLVETIRINPEYINFFTQNDTYPLINSLLSLLQSPDSDISTQAGDSILRLLSSSNEHSLKLITERTPFCEIVINKVIQLYNEIPRNLNPHEIEVSMGIIQHYQFSNTSFSHAVRKFLSFLKWLMFYDSLIVNSPKESFFIEILLKKICTEFIEAFILPDLLGHGFDSLEESIDNCYLTTVILLNSLKASSSDQLSQSITEILSIRNCNQYYPYHPNVAKTLIQRCNLKTIISSSYSEEFKQKQYKLASVTFQLFERILSKPVQCFLDKVVLNDLKDFHEQKDVKNLKPELNESFIHRFGSDKLFCDIEESFKNFKHPNDNHYRFVENDKLEAILYYFYSLIPNEFRFGNDSDYEAYAKEALEAFKSDFWILYKNSDNISINHDDDHNGNTVDDDESLDMIDIFLENVQYISKLPYEIGVQLFSCLAKISMIPDQRIDSKLLDSTIDDSSKITLFNALFKLISELQIMVSGIENLNHKLTLIKKILLGEVKKKAEYSGSIEEQQILQSIIVVDEFCREIAAICLVKQKIFAIL